MAQLITQRSQPAIAIGYARRSLRAMAGKSIESGRQIGLRTNGMRRLDCCSFYLPPDWKRLVPEPTPPTRSNVQFDSLRNMRNNVRNMRNSSVFTALFPQVRQGVLAATLGQPDKWWYLSELAGRLGTSPSSLQRELSSLVASGILMHRREGTRAYFKAETSPRCSETCSSSSKKRQVWLRSWSRY